MEKNEEIWDNLMVETIAIINLIIGVQSLFLAIHFFFKKKGIIQLNKLMALITLCFTFIVFNTYYSLSKPFPFLLLQDIANNSMWFLAPSIFLYVKYKEHIISNKIIQYHLIPYLIPFFIDLFFQWEIYERYIPLIALIQIVNYLFVSIKIASNGYKRNVNYYHWILPVVGSLAIIVLCNFLFLILHYTEIYQTSSIFRQSFTTLMMFPIFFLSFKEMNTDAHFGLTNEKYKSSKISNEKTEDYLFKIKSYLETEKHFLDKSITLTVLSDKLGISSKYISQIVNQELNLSFSEYLLFLRISEAKKLLLSEEKSHLSIAGIAEESGFTSTSSFNLNFKKSTGSTPSGYKQKNNKNS